MPLINVFILAFMTGALIALAVWLVKHKGL